MKKLFLKYIVMGLIAVAAAVSMACSVYIWHQPQTPKALED